MGLGNSSGSALLTFNRVMAASPLCSHRGLPLTWFIVVGGIVSLPLLILMPDYSYRYGLQWLGFYFGCSALVFVQASCVVTISSFEGTAFHRRLLRFC